MLRYKSAVITTFTFVLLMAFMLSAGAFMAHGAEAGEGLYGKAVNAYLKKEYRTAEEILLKYVEKTPDPKGYFLLGYAYYNMKKHEKASEYFDEAYLVDPEFDPAVVLKDLK